MHWKIVVFFLCKDKKTKDDNFSSSKHDIMYVIHRMREISRQKTREISKGVEIIKKIHVQLYAVLCFSEPNVYWIILHV